MSEAAGEGEEEEFDFAGQFVSSRSHSLSLLATKVYTTIAS